MEQVATRCAESPGRPHLPRRRSLYRSTQLRLPKHRRQNLHCFSASKDPNNRTSTNRAPKMARSRSAYCESARRSELGSSRLIQLEASSSSTLIPGHSVWRAVGGAQPSPRLIGRSSTICNCRGYRMRRARGRRRGRPQGGPKAPAARCLSVMDVVASSNYGVRPWSYPARLRKGNSKRNSRSPVRESERARSAAGQPAPRALTATHLAKRGTAHKPIR
jgi:hypothetical protein